MKISSESYSILSVARQPSVGKASNERGDGEARGATESAALTTGVSYSQGHSSFRSTLAHADVENAAAATDGTNSSLTTGGLMSDALSQSDWDTIQKATGLTPANDKTGAWLDADGHRVESGPAFEKAGSMVFAMSTIRLFGTDDGSGNMVPVSGEITVEILQEYISRYQSDAIAVRGLQEAIDLLML